MFQSDLLKEQNILITGGGSGLGLAFAEKLGALGATVAICGRTEAKLAEACRRLEAKGVKAVYYMQDVRDYEGVGQMLEHFDQETGGLTGLVNNAAGNFMSASEQLSPNGFKAVVDIVLHGTFNCTRQLGARWIERKQKGAVVNIVTTYTQTGCAFVLPSACAKAGVEALTNTLAYEWGKLDIRLNSVAPGPFPTEGAWTRLVPDEKFHNMMEQQHPMGRVGDPEELANTVAFLLSDLASYINGATLTVDGGERLQGAQFNKIMQAYPREQLLDYFDKMRARAQKD